MGKRNSALDQLKYEVSQELGYINRGAQDLNYEISEELGLPSDDSRNSVRNSYSQYLQNAKFETANELGIQLNKDYNGDMTSRDAGRIGGRIGGKIGGNMVRKMVEFAENNLNSNGTL